MKWQPIVTVPHERYVLVKTDKCQAFHYDVHVASFSPYHMWNNGWEDVQGQGMDKPVAWCELPEEGKDD